MGDFINYTSGTSILFTSFGLIRLLSKVENMDRCARININAGLSLALLTGGLMVRRAYIK
tara:strand:- start:418 stop:597 length:180 start_codon:yes stop_codon:yes gene_type:complete